MVIWYSFVEKDKVYVGGLFVNYKILGSVEILSGNKKPSS